MGAQLRDENQALVALLRTVPKGTRWSDVTEQVLDRGSAIAVWDQHEPQELLPSPDRPEALAAAARDLEQWRLNGWEFLSILGKRYPARLRDIHQAPPFLFASGQLLNDDRAVAVVGSRKASSRGRDITAAVSAELVSNSVTVLSGLAEGIDAAAHDAALNARGRTVAIIGTGMARSYPAANRELQKRIIADGLVLSQFWPDAPPQPHNFIMRNAVMSGYGQATVVVEAGEKSGARAQARMAVEHGRPVILTDLVVAATQWGKQLQNRPGVYVASGLNEVMDHVRKALAQDRNVDALLKDLVGSAL